MHPILELTAAPFNLFSFHFQIYVNTMNLIFNMIVPFLTMGVMNYMIYLAINRRPTRGSGSFGRSPNTYYRSRLSLGSMRRSSAQPLGVRISNGIGNGSSDGENEGQNQQV